MIRKERGSTLLETIVALALLGIIGVNFLSATATTTSARVTADEHASARIIAESQLEDIKLREYDSSYTANETLLTQFPGYAIEIDADSLGTGLQKITVTVSHHDREISSLECYRVDRG